MFYDHHLFILTTMYSEASLPLSLRQLNLKSLKAGVQLTPTKLLFKRLHKTIPCNWSHWNWIYVLEGGLTQNWTQKIISAAGKYINSKQAILSYTFILIHIHYWIAKDLLIHKAPILSNFMLKWSPYFIDQFKTRTLRGTSKLQLLEPKCYTVVHTIYHQNG